METIQDFEDMLFLLKEHRVRYLIIGGLAFIYHAKPRYTKDMDIWIDPAPSNIKSANEALEDFGCPYLLSPDRPEDIQQIGVEPDRIDFVQVVSHINFSTVWEKRVVDRYGEVEANWIDLDSLIETKRSIDNPRHQEDVRVLLEVKKLHR
jgi:hypothetical protein